MNKEEKTGQPSSSDPTSPKNEKEGDENTVVGEDTMKGPLEIKFPSRDQKTTISEVPNKADLKVSFSFFLFFFFPILNLFDFHGFFF